MLASTLVFAFLFLLQLAVIMRALTRRHRNPASRIAWVAVIAAIPLVGIVAYILFGETNIGHQRIARMKKVIAGMPSMAAVKPGDEANAKPNVPAHYLHLFDTGKSINGFDVVGGNSASLMADSNSSIDSMIADIDEATEHVHLMFYIWLTDNNGTRMMEALKRATARGVKCRAMVDDLGSRQLVKSPQWKDMADAGVDVAIALPLASPLLGPLKGRLDLRNHRKILIIDGRITYCGSQNCADPEFLVKQKFAPWVDAVMRFEGPIVRQNQYLFANDWMCYASEDIDELLRAPIEAPAPGFAAQVVGTGPTFRNSAMTEMFESLFHAARRELIITTPYFVPDEPMQNALCAAAWRGVKTTMVVPARNDSWIVGAASRSYYADLLEAGVDIHEFNGGLLHTKSLTMDGEITLIGSANMDRRGFDLNYENNILLQDRATTLAVSKRQCEYLSDSTQVELPTVLSWSDIPTKH